MKQVIQYIILLITLNSCFEIADIDLKNTEPSLVIEAKITDEPGPYRVLLSLSSNFDDPNHNHPISDAMVRISDNTGEVDTLTLVEPGIFETTSIQGSVGNLYTLNVDYDDIQYTASSRLDRVGIIDSLAQKFEEESIILDEGYYVTLYAQKSYEDRINYYKWSIYQEDSLLDGRQFLLIGSDEYANSLNGLELVYPFSAGDSITWQMESLTQEAYDYYIQLNLILNNDGVVTQIRNINPPTNFTPSVLGIFQTSAVRYQSIVIDE